MKYLFTLPLNEHMAIYIGSLVSSARMTHNNYPLLNYKVRPK
jgi:hypothetical protein